jgi:post-segregation antitoxin (ccd killing protein)
VRHNDKRGLLCTAFLALAVAVALILSMSGCAMVNFISDGARLDTIEGSGEIVTQDFDVADFTKLRVDGDYIVQYTKSEEYKISVEMQESLFEYLTVESVDGKLTVYSENLLRNSDIKNRNPRLYVSAPTLEEMDFAGSVVVEESETIEGGTFGLRISGASDVNLNLNVDEVLVEVAGAGNLNLSGTATYAIVDIAGAANLEAFALNTMNAKITLSGAGNGQITCTGNLDVEISGAGSIEYMGDATLTQNIAGLGTVRKVD